MEKIPTLFERDPTTRKVTAARAVELPELVGSLVTEKVDGQNVRLTVRHGELVRIEARKKPHKTQKERAKAAGAVIDPWYREAWIFGGRMNSALLEFEDGYRVVTSRSGLRRA
jgi:hypothetical protein